MSRAWRPRAGIFPPFPDRQLCQLEGSLLIHQADPTGLIDPQSCQLERRSELASAGIGLGLAGGEPLSGGITQIPGSTVRHLDQRGFTEVRETGPDAEDLVVGMGGDDEGLRGQERVVGYTAARAGSDVRDAGFRRRSGLEQAGFRGPTGVQAGAKQQLERQRRKAEAAQGQHRIQGHLVQKHLEACVQQGIDHEHGPDQQEPWNEHQDAGAERMPAASTEVAIGQRHQHEHEGAEQERGEPHLRRRGWQRTVGWHEQEPCGVQDQADQQTGHDGDAGLPVGVREQRRRGEQERQDAESQQR